MLGSVRTVPKSWDRTVLLPKSLFPPRPLIADRPKYLERCTVGLYAWQRKNRTGDTFTLHDGPPYANGPLHVGHALNKILKDISCRVKLLQGYRINYVPGWDCHGLPIELKAIEQNESLVLSIDSHRTSKAIHVRSSARKLASDAVEEQKKSFQQWGIMADWDYAWKSMDKDFELRQLKVFRDLVKKEYIYRRFKPVYWSPSSRTALAESELEYNEDHVSTAAFVKYPVTNLRATAADNERNGVSAVIWTTTPWTLPANRAIGVRPEMEYAIVRAKKHGFLIVAKARLDAIAKAIKEPLNIVRVLAGSDLIEATYTDPVFTGESRPFLHADFVSADSGSGLVHLAPGHGKDDYQLCLRHNITAFAPVDDEGRFTKAASPNDPDLLVGKEVLAGGNRAVMDFLSSRGLLLHSHNYKHKYPYDWRSKQPVILRATEQWFANVGEIQDAAIKSLDAVTFIPEGSKERLTSFVKNRSEWCISRQRAWGVPIPALYDLDTGEAILTEESITHILEVIENRGVDAWWTDDALDPAWVPPCLRESHPNATYHRGKDTMDVWFDSGTSWTQMQAPQIGDANTTVADVYLEGSDQHRGWFQSSLLLCVAQQHATNHTAQPQAPFQTLVTHGFTLDDRARKMSKSIGNVISPDQIMDGTLLPKKKKKGLGASDAQPSYDAMGPDALRLWVASCDFTKDVVISQTVLKGIHSTLSKYRGTFRVLLGMLEDYNPQGAMPNFEDLRPIHQITLLQLGKAVESAQLHYEQFEFNRVVHEMNHYINTDLSSFYIESIKDTVYTDSCHTSHRLEAQSVLLQIYYGLLSLLAPITPLLVEEAWEYATEPIKQLSCKVDLTRRRSDTLEQDLPWLLRASAAVKSAQEQARAAKKLGSSLQCEVLFQVGEAPDNSNDRAQRSLLHYLSTLETLLVVSGVDVCQGSEPQSVRSAEWAYHANFELWGSDITAHVYTPTKSKCIRCRKYTADTGTDEQTALCGRCEAIVDELRIHKPELFVPLEPPAAMAA